MELLIVALYILAFLTFLSIISRGNISSKIISFSRKYNKYIFIFTVLKKNIYKTMRNKEGLKLLFSIIRDKIFVFCGGHITSIHTLKYNKRKFHYLDYFYNDARYRVLWPTKIIPSTPIISAVDEEGFDILDIIKPCMGPDEMFHGSLFTPRILGFNEITFTSSSGLQRKFKGDQTILLEH